jgi:hypothetical protein
MSRFFVRTTLCLVLTGCFVLLALRPSIAVEPRAGLWTAGAGMGVIGDTPVGTAFALDMYADRFLDSSISLGGLVQIINFKEIAMSPQFKYWFDVRLPNPDAKMNVQAGLGFFHAKSDNSYIIPIGLGLDYPLDRRMSFTMSLLMDFTAIDAGLGSGVHLMPALILGVRF